MGYVSREDLDLTYLEVPWIASTGGIGQRALVDKVQGPPYSQQELCFHLYASLHSLMMEFTE